MLAEIRSRAVDVETGVAPRAMRALPRDETVARAVRNPRPRSPAPRRPTRQVQVGRRRYRSAPVARRVEPVSPPSRVVARAEHERAANLLVEGRVLCLDDPPAGTAGDRPPWAGGLRG